MFVLVPLFHFHPSSYRYDVCLCRIDALFCCLQKNIHVILAMIVKFLHFLLHCTFYGVRASEEGHGNECLISTREQFSYVLVVNKIEFKRKKKKKRVEKKIKESTQKFSRLVAIEKCAH